MIRQTRCNSNRGSALLMIVGLLTILALLGGTFLIVARYERKQAQALESSPEPDGRAQDVANSIAAKLVEDLFISGTSGPYTSAASTIPLTWRRFIDCPPAEVVDSAVDNDFWLASFMYTDNSGVKTWPQISRAVADTTTTNYINQSAESASLEDIDGDGIKDSFPSDLDIALLNGNRYAVSARIVDLSALVNLNTAGNAADTTLTQICPTSVNIVNLKSSAGATIDATMVGKFYNGTNAAAATTQGRNGTQTSATLQQYYDNCGVKLANPLTGYAPFQPSLEGLYLHWLSVTNPKEEGRVYTITGGINASVRKFLTTTSTSRTRVRYPASLNINNGNRVRLIYGSTSTQGTLSHATTRQQLYEQLCQTVNTTLSATDQDTERRKIAQFLVNLWAYTATGTEIRGNNFVWQPFLPGTTSNDTGAGVVYAAVPQLVISDVFAVHASPSPIPSAVAAPFWNNDSGYAYGVELLNPTNVAIDPANYTISCNGSAPVALSAAMGGSTTVIQPGDTVVLYNFGGQAVTNKSAAISTLFGSSATWHTWSGLNFANTNASSAGVVLQETRGGTVFPIDQVKPADFGWPTGLVADRNTATEDPADPNRVNRTACAGCYRDGSVTTTTNQGRDRALIGDSTSTGHGFSKPTALDASTANDTSITTFVRPLGNKENFADLATALSAISGCSQGFYFHFDDSNYSSGQHKISNFADIANIYLVGPTPSESLPQALNNYATNANRGRVDFSATPFYNTTSATSYPDVPWPTLFNELTEVLATESVTVGANTIEKVYGRININTAPKEVLMQLPFYVDANGNGVRDAGEELDRADATEETTLGAIADAIITYRDDPTSRPTGVRTNSQYRGFCTPGEIAIPLNTYAASVITSADTTTQIKGRISLYRSIANVITVNSDTYAAYITVHLKKPLGNPLVLNSWSYLAIFDRSSCMLTTDSPEVKLPLTRIK